MSWQKRKGTAGENAVVNYLALWYPDAEESGEGIPFRRITSQGSKDVGDVDGPFTSIEVKNHSNPAASALLDNAEWKARNSGKPYWFLVYKAAGLGDTRTGGWHVLMTVEELFLGYRALHSPVEHPSLSTVADINEHVPALCEGWAEHPAIISTPAPKRLYPTHPWTLRLVYTDMLSQVPRRRQELWEQHSDVLNQSDRVVPFIIYPRRDENHELLPAAKWYAYTKLAGVTRVLETLGILPQDEAEYSLPALLPS